jgi:hypothetical protein
MTNDPLFHRFLEISWRRKLTEAETAELRAWLAQHPEALGDWEIEAALDHLLARLPDAPMPSNFTARVLVEAQRQARDPQLSGRNWQFWKWRLNWLPRVALAALVLGTGTVIYRQHETAQQNKALVENLGLVSMPSPEILTNFQAIRYMTVANASPSADVQLLTLMQ